MSGRHLEGPSWEVELRLPWPPVKLQPNQAPRNLAATWAAKKRYRQACFDAARRQLRQLAVPPVPLLGDVAAVAIYHPPDARLRDLDNCHSAMKRGFDGVAKALGVDDRRFRPWTLDWGEQEPGGLVVLRLAVPALPSVRDLAGAGLLD